MKIYDRLPKGDWRLVRAASREWLELVANAYMEAGAEDVACVPKRYCRELPPIEIEYNIYAKGSFSIRKLEEKLFN